MIQRITPPTSRPLLGQQKIVAQKLLGGIVLMLEKLFGHTVPIFQKFFPKTFQVYYGFGSFPWCLQMMRVELAVAPCGSSEKNCWGWEGVSIFRSVCADRPQENEHIYQVKNKNPPKLKTLPKLIILSTLLLVFNPMFQTQSMVERRNVRMGLGLGAVIVIRHFESTLPTFDNKFTPQIKSL